MVFPAPVSPVMTFSPGARRNSARSMSRRFSMRSSASTREGVPAAEDGRTDRDRIRHEDVTERGSDAGGEAPELLAQAVVEGRTGDLGKRRRAVVEPRLDPLPRVERA